ncbi:unnamed protein product, partial [Closterium sp. NIES-65]
CGRAAELQFLPSRRAAVPASSRAAKPPEPPCPLAIGQTVSPSLTSPLVPLLPLLLMLTTLFAHSGPHAMLLHVLLCGATCLPLSVRTLA